MESRRRILMRNFSLNAILTKVWSSLPYNYVMLTDNAEGLWFSRWENSYTARFARGNSAPRPIISHSTAPLAIRHRTVDLHKRSNEDIITTWKVSSAFDRPRSVLEYHLWESRRTWAGWIFNSTVSRGLKTKLKFIQARRRERETSYKLRCKIS